MKDKKSSGEVLRELCIKNSLVVLRQSCEWKHLSVYSRNCWNGVTEEFMRGFEIVRKEDDSG